jgi:serine/threonine protein kinase
MCAMNPGGLGGTLIDGRFELLDRLGGGGMGLVWRARDVMLHREVALKEVRSGEPGSFDFDPEGTRTMRERVLREARALARLHHPNVVTIYHIVDTPELAHPWLVMELVTGGSLHDRLQQGPLTPQDTARVGRGVLAALRAAHEAGIQHRDVKPANVLLRPDGTPVLTDFGIAALRESTALTTTGSLIGSPEFIAPERLRGEEGNPASDLWSLGIMIYAAVEGYSPLRRNTTIATLAAVLDEPIPAPLRSGPLLPALSAVLIRDPAVRCGPDQFDRLLAAAESSPGAGIGIGMGTNPSPGSSLGQSLGQSPVLGRSLRERETPVRVPASYGSTGAESWSPPETGHRRHEERRGRKAVFATSVVGTAAVGLISALIWTQGNDPKSNDLGDQERDSASAPAASAGDSAGAAGAGITQTSQTTPTLAPTTAATTGSGPDLLTVAGMNSLISDVRSVMGDTKVTDFTVFPDTASGDVLTSRDQTLYDDFEYSEGQGSDTGPGGTLDSGDETTDLTSFNWNALPALLATAQQDFKVTGTPEIYVMVDPDWLDDGPTLRVYVTDDYDSGGYITANQQGKVTGKY